MGLIKIFISFFISFFLFAIETLLFLYLLQFYFLEELNLNEKWKSILFCFDFIFFIFQIFLYFVFFNSFGLINFFLSFFISFFLSAIETLLFLYILKFYFLEELNLNEKWKPILFCFGFAFFIFQIFLYFAFFDSFVSISLALIHTFLLVHTIKNLNLNRKMTWFGIICLCWLILALRFY